MLHANVAQIKLLMYFGNCVIFFKSLNIIMHQLSTFRFQSAFLTFFAKTFNYY